MSSIPEIPIGDYVAAPGPDDQLIDVREPEEFALGSLPGAINIPLNDLDERLEDIQTTRRVVLLCRSGNRSGQACELLISQGFDAVNLAGGMLDYEG